MTRNLPEETRGLKEQVDEQPTGKRTVHVYTRKEIIEPLMELLPSDTNISRIANEAWIKKLNELREQQKAAS